MDLPSDLIDLLAEFDASGVEFHLVGGHAQHPPSRIDLMKGVPGGDFERAWKTRTTVTVSGVSVSLLSRPELIRLERASGRPQDLLDAQLLENTERG